MWVARIDREREWAFATLHVPRGTCVYVLGFILLARDMVWGYRKQRDEEKTREIQSERARGDWQGRDKIRKAR